MVLLFVRSKGERMMKENHWKKLLDHFGWHFPKEISNMQNKNVKSCISIKASYSEKFPIDTYYKEMLQKDFYNTAYVSFNSCASGEIKLIIRKKL